jgi:hypothetical protein
MIDGLKEKAVVGHLIFLGGSGTEGEHSFPYIGYETLNASQTAQGKDVGMDLVNVTKLRTGAADDPADPPALCGLLSALYGSL